MPASDLLRGLVVVSHGGVDLAGAAEALTDAGVVVDPHATGRDTVHLVPYGDCVAVITDPDAAPCAWLDLPVNGAWLVTAVRTAAELKRADRAMQESHALLQICRAMGSQRDAGALHRMIVRKARELTNADAGSLYLLETVDGSPALRFAVAQTGPHDRQEHAGSYLALSEESIAGCVAVRGQPIRVADAYAELPEQHVRFDASFDRAAGYSTRSVLAVPIRNYRDEIVGVLQLINRKPTFEAVLPQGVLTEQLVMPFDERDFEILVALAAQAGVVLENSRRFEGRG